MSFALGLTRGYLLYDLGRVGQSLPLCRYNLFSVLAERPSGEKLGRSKFEHKGDNNEQRSPATRYFTL